MEEIEKPPPIEISTEEVQFLLDQNSYLIKSILKLQQEGRVLDAMIYKSRLQMNLEKLSSIASSKSQVNEDGSALTEDPTADSQILLSKFVRSVKQNGLKSIRTISEITSIPVEKITPLSIAYISFLKRQNRFTEAQQLEKELAMNGIDGQSNE